MVKRYYFSAQPIDESGAIGYDPQVDPPTLKNVEFEALSAGDLLKDAEFAKWLDERQSGEAWDVTIEIEEVDVGMLSDGSLHREIEELIRGEVPDDKLESASVLLVDMGIRDVSEITDDDMDELRERGLTS
jgi:hypothetical protein